jgi:cytoskeletal protein RodZ
MHTDRPRRLGFRGSAGIVLAATALVALSACGNDDPDASATTPGTTTSASPTETTPSESPSESPSEDPSSTPTTTDTSAPKPEKMHITIKGGIVKGTPAAPKEVSIGQTVQIKIKSDVADTLHVVGIEQSIAVPADETVTLEFEVPADPGAGTYDVKFDTSGLVLFQFAVT